MGAEVNEALKLIDQSELQPVIVAVIDDGVDIYHEDFEGKIWVNQDEIPGNGIDDDGNGFIDDRNGWNFLGNPSGENIKFETLELTRLYREFDKRFGGKSVNDIGKNERKEFQQYLKLKKEFEAELSTVKEQFSEYAQLSALFEGASAYLSERIPEDELSPSSLEAFVPSTDDEKQVKEFMTLAYAEGLEGYLESGGDYFSRFLDYNLNLEYDPRWIVNEEEFPESYGNNMVWAESPDHGTHVAGIIAAVRNNDYGIDGIAPNALIMPLRAVPGGDERDKDIALAIRYAVDNGAKIINMSFGKGYSPDAELVIDAAKYAESKNVLLVHAAGNDASNNDVVDNYPDGRLGRKKPAKNWITVAASHYSSSPSILADFSNYGAKSVDILAPGVEILSLAPDNQTAAQSGTSMAAPVVSGVAAIVWGFSPDLSARDVKRILIQSGNDVGDYKITIDGGTESVDSVIINPAIVSAQNAIESLKTER